MCFKSILHPTDFSEQSMVAFYHALKLALIQKSKLTLMYVTSKENDVLDWEKFPKVRDTLFKWGLISKNASRKDVYTELGVEVKKIIGKNSNIIDSVVGIVDHEEIDLIVMATHGSKGLPKWINPSISEPISRESMVPTLFIPYNCKPFVSSENGKFDLNKILIPIDHKPRPQRAVDYGINVGKIYGENKTRFYIMHVLDKKKNWSEKDMPEINLPKDEDFIVRLEHRAKSVSYEIIKVANEVKADLLVIATEGHTGFLDVLQGSTSEQILHQSKHPILTIPNSNRSY